MSRCSSGNASIIDWHPSFEEVLTASLTPCAVDDVSLSRKIRAAGMVEKNAGLIVEIPSVCTPYRKADVLIRPQPARFLRPADEKPLCHGHYRITVSRWKNSFPNLPSELITGLTGWQELDTATGKADRNIASVL